LIKEHVQMFTVRQEWAGSCYKNFSKKREKNFKK